MIKNV